MRLEGSLDAFSLPDIFSLLFMTKKTGGLHLRRDGVEGVVWLSDGAITGAASDVARASLARRIAGGGEVDEPALSDAVERVGNEAIGIARSLHEADAIDEGLLHSLIAEQVTDAIFDLLRWPDGGFEFVVDEVNIDDVGVARPVDEVVNDARQRMESWSALAEQVPSTETVLSWSTAPDDETLLSRDDWLLLSLVDGRRTVADLVNLGGRGEFAMVTALADLIERGLLQADADAVDALVRRQSVLDRLEGTVPPQRADTADASEPATVEPTPTSDEPAEPDQIEDSASEPSEPTVDHDSDDEPADEETDEAATDDAAAGVPAHDKAALTVVPGQGRDLSAVTPQRPEPFMVARTPDHPEPVAAVAGGGAAAAPAASSAIERDPSVNKSLLLRLIAGVRGL